MDTGDEPPLHHGLSPFGKVSGDSVGSRAWEQQPGGTDVVLAHTSPMLAY